MKKDYQNWMSLKQALNNIDAPNLFFHQREVWYCHLGENIGAEQDGTGEQFLRPVLIVRKFNNDIFWGVPLTRTEKNLPFYCTFVLQPPSGENIKNERSMAVLSQIRLIDAKRLRRMIGHISKKDFATLTKKLKALLP